MNELKRFAAGDLTDDEAQPLEEHLLSCPDCVARMPEVDHKDTFFDALRAATATSDSAIATVDTGIAAFHRQTIAAQSDDAGAEKLDFLAPAQSFDELGRLGGYRVLRVIGTGGMGIVFEAEDVRLKRHVALKVMKPEMAANPQSRQRFLREAQAMAALDHDHVVTVHQVGEDGGVPFLAMQFLRGESLDARLKRATVEDGLPSPSSKKGDGLGRPSSGNALPLDEVLRIGREVADGLAAAHERGLIHRDIKPGNIWLETGRGRPRVKILDFGLAHVADADADLTQSAAILGTPSYMAPEQARGEAVDARADLFSLGCVLYRMTTGQAPFKGASALSVLMSLATTTPPAPRELNPDVPAELNGLIVALLSKHPVGRPASAREVMEQLAGVGWALPTAANVSSVPSAERNQASGIEHQEGSVGNALSGDVAQPPSAMLAADAATVQDGLPSPSSIERDGLGSPSSEKPVVAAAVGNAHPTKPPRRHGLTSVAIAAAAAALLAGVVVVIKDREGNVVATVETNDAAKVKASPEYNVEVKPSDAAESSKSTGQDPKSKVQDPKSEERPERKNQAVHEGPETAHQSSATEPKSKTQDLSPKISPLNPKSEIPNPKSLPPLGPMALVTEPTAIEGVKGWTVETIGPRGRIYQAEFSPDGTLVATLGIDATLRLWKAATGNLVRAMVGCTAGQHTFAWSPDGKQIAVAENSRILVWEGETGKRLKSFDIERATQVFNAAFSPDGGTLAVLLLRGIGEKPDAVELYAAESGELLDAHRTFCGWYPWIDGESSTPTTRLSWSPDGQRLTIGNEIWDTAASASRDAGAGHAITWRDDGALVKAVPVGRDDKAAIELWRVDTNERLHTLSGDKEAIRFRAFSPHGKFVLATAARIDTSDEEARAYIFDTTSGTLVYKRELLPDDEGYTQYALSPDAKNVLAFGPLAGNLWSVAAAADDGPPGPSRDANDAPRGAEGGAHDGAGRLSSAAAAMWKRPALLGHAGGFVSAWSPDAECLATRGSGDALTLWQLHSGQPRVTRNIPGYSLDWSSEDGLIRAWGRVECVAYDPATGQQRHWEGFANRDGWLYASLDGNRVAAVREKETTIHAADTGQALRTMAAESKYAATWSLDPSRLMTVGEKTTLWDLDSGEAIKTIDASAPADWSPDGKRLAFVYEDGKRIEIRDVESGQPVVELENDPPLIVPRVRLAWSRDGARLAGLGRIWDAENGKTLCLLPRYPPTWVARFTLSYDPNPANVDFRARWSPHSAYLAYLAADRSVPVVEAASGRIATTLLSFTHDRTMAISPSGHFHCSPRFESELVYIVETDSGQETVSPREFAEKYGWRNDASKVAPTLRGGEPVAGGNLLASPSQSAGATASADASTPQDDLSPHAPRGENYHAERGVYGGRDANGVNPKSKIHNPKSLGPLALVQRPAPLPGVESWSLEPALLAGVFASDQQAIALSPNGKLLTLGGEEGHVRIYDVFQGNTPRLSKLLIGHASRVVAVEFSHDGKWIASAEADQPNVRIWETATGKFVSSTLVGLNLQAFQVRLSWSPDNSMLAVGADGDVSGGAVLLDGTTGEVIRSLSAPEFRKASSFSWSPDGAKLAVASLNRVYIFDAATGEFENRDMSRPDIQGGTGGPTVAWSPDGKAIALSIGSHDTLVFSVADGTLRAKLPVKAGQYESRTLRWTDRGTRLGLNTDGQWQEWDVDRGERADVASSTPRLAHSADGSVIAAASAYGAYIWGIDLVDTRTKKHRNLNFRRSSGCVAWSADGRTLAESGGDSVIWNRDRAPHLECLPRLTANGTTALTWLPENGSLFGALGGLDAAIWSRGKQRWEPKMLGIAIGGWAVTTAISSDGKRIAYIANGTDGKTVTIYDLAAGAKLREIGPHPAAVSAIAWSPDATQFITGIQTGEMTKSNCETGEMRRRATLFPEGHPGNESSYVTNLSWSPDGQTIMAAYHGKIYLCDADLNIQHELPVHDSASSLAAVAWPKDGRELLTLDDHQIRRWEVASGKRLDAARHALPKPYRPTWRFSPDLARIAATGATCRVVNAGSGQQQAAVVPLLGGKAVVISADGHYVESALKAADQLVYVVQTAAGQELLSPKEFAAKYGWKNNPSNVKLH